MRSHNDKKRQHWRRSTIAAILTCIGLGAGTGDSIVYVNRLSQPIRTGKFAFDKIVGTALQGDKLNVIATEGRYLKVSYSPRDKPPIEGYVLQDALSSYPPQVNMTANTGDAAQVGAVGAGKGILDSKAFAAAHGLTSHPFYAMVTDSDRAMRNADGVFDQFMKTGKLGPYKPRTTRPTTRTMPTTQP